MKVGDKYIIEIEEVIRHNGAPQIARIKGFNALVFDKYGLEKLEPYNEERGYYKNYKDGYDDGYVDGKNAVMDESEKITSKDISDAYNKGLNDAWKLVKRIENAPDKGGLWNAQIAEVFGKYYVSQDLYNKFSPDEALDLYRRWEDEQKQDAEIIKVGDEVVIDDKGRKAVVSRALDNGLYNIVFYNGDTNCVDRCFISKTGRHFDAIAEVLAELRGEE